MVRARNVRLTVKVNTMLTNTQLRGLQGLVFGQLKGGERQTIKRQKPVGTQHDCYGLIDGKPEVKDLGASKAELWDPPSGHPARKDLKPKRRTKKARRTAKRRAARDTKKEAKGVIRKSGPRKPRPSEVAAREARAAAKAAAQEATPAAAG